MSDVREKGPRDRMPPDHKIVDFDHYWRVISITPKTELWSGQPTPRVPASGEYGLLVGRIAGWLAVQALPAALGDVYASECAFFVPELPQKPFDPDYTPPPNETDWLGTILVPDVAFVRAERLTPYPERPAFLHVAPDLAVGITEAPIWESHPLVHLDEYLAAGVPLIWLVDALDQTVTVHAPGAEPRVLRGDDVLDGIAALPDFRLPVATLFR